MRARCGSNVCSSASADLPKSCWELRIVWKALKEKMVSPEAMDATLSTPDMMLVVFLEILRLEELCKTSLYAELKSLMNERTSCRQRKSESTCAVTSNGKRRELSRHTDEWIFINREARCRGPLKPEISLSRSEPGPPTRRYEDFRSTDRSDKLSLDEFDRLKPKSVAAFSSHCVPCR